MVEFDAGFLAILFHPNPGLPPDPQTGKPVTQTKERIEFLINTLSDSGEKILIPTPALAEVLIALGKVAAAQAVDNLHGESAFQIGDFDERSAIELSLMSELGPGETKRKGQQGTWVKVKFYRQIVAIAKVNGVKTIYSTDEEVQKLAIKEGIKAIALHELPLPPPATPKLPFDEEKSHGETNG